jgi:hypothetical protein
VGVVQQLLERNKTESNSKDDLGMTLLAKAARYGREEVVRLLLEQDDADVSSKDNNGRTVLSVAATYGHTEVVQLLLERGDSDVNSRDNCGRTPLSRAACRGHRAVVRLILKRDDVKCDTVDTDGYTPLSLATACLQGPMLQLFREWGGFDACDIDTSFRSFHQTLLLPNRMPRLMSLVEDFDATTVDIVGHKAESSDFVEHLGWDGAAGEPVEGQLGGRMVLDRAI